MPHVSAATWQEQSQKPRQQANKTFLGALTSAVSLTTAPAEQACRRALNKER
jgi:hypothetical protein